MTAVTDIWCRTADMWSPSRCKMGDDAPDPTKPRDVPRMTSKFGKRNFESISQTNRNSTAGRRPGGRKQGASGKEKSPASSLMMETGNYVERLNEYAQKTRCGPPQYEDLGSVGPDHDRMWVQSLCVGHRSVFVWLQACSGEMWLFFTDIRWGLVLKH